MRVILANVVETFDGHAIFFREKSGYRERTKIVTRSGVGSLVAASAHATLMIPPVVP